MTLIEKRRTEDPTVGGATGAVATGDPRRTWIVVSAVIFFAVVGSIWVAHTGLSGSSRGNPAGHLTRENPLFGITNWPAIFSSIFVVVSLVMGVGFAWLSMRQGSMHHLLI